VVLDPVSGARLRTLVATGVVGDSVALNARDHQVYFEEDLGCAHEVWRVDVAGGAPSRVALGSAPAISPDGARLAYALEHIGCGGSDPRAEAAYVRVMVKDLRTGVIHQYPTAPRRLREEPPLVIRHLSWSADGVRLALSLEPWQDDTCGVLAVMDPAVDRYYVPSPKPDPGLNSNSNPDPSPDAAPVSVPGVNGSCYLEGGYLPDGHLFVIRQVPQDAERGSSGPWRYLMEEIAPGSGVVLRTVAIGERGRPYLAPSADASGQWLLYLSGPDLKVVHGEARARTLASGYLAADW